MLLRLFFLVFLLLPTLVVATFVLAAAEAAAEAAAAADVAAMPVVERTGKPAFISMSGMESMRAKTLVAAPPARVNDVRMSSRPTV